MMQCASARAEPGAQGFCLLVLFPHNRSHLPVDTLELSAASSSKQSIKQKGIGKGKITVGTKVALCSKELTGERTTGQTGREKGI